MQRLNRIVIRALPALPLLVQVTFLFLLFVADGVPSVRPGAH